ncbi:hypothetical protein DIZ76_016527 [Coccidioides immitis]|nr:hypothetical protein DIZ76_016527 [Coccidioides immitis]
MPTYRRLRHASFSFSLETLLFYMYVEKDLTDNANLLKKPDSAPEWLISKMIVDINIRSVSTDRDGRIPLQYYTEIPYLCEDIQEVVGAEK